MTHMDPKHYQIVATILSQYPEYQFYVFGSRARGDAQTYSDLDLCCLQSIPRVVIGDIQEKLNNSRLPYKVDIVDLTRSSNEFKELIKPDIISFELFAPKCLM